MKEEGDDTGVGDRGLDERSMKISYSLVWDLKIISEVARCHSAWPWIC